MGCDDGRNWQLRSLGNISSHHSGYLGRVPRSVTRGIGDQQKERIAKPSSWWNVTFERANYTTHPEVLQSMYHWFCEPKQLGKSYTSNLSRKGWE